jgi:hypothetical protein
MQTPPLPPLLHPPHSDCSAQLLPIVSVSAYIYSERHLSLFVSQENQFIRMNTLNESVCSPDPQNSEVQYRLQIYRYYFIPYRLFSDKKVITSSYRYISFNFILKMFLAQIFAQNRDLSIIHDQQCRGTGSEIPPFFNPPDPE